MAYDFAAVDAQDPTGYDDGKPLWADLTALGTNLTESILQYKTSQNQINHGQVPSTGIGPNGLITAQNVAQQTLAQNAGLGLNIGGTSLNSSTLLLIGGLLVVLVVVSSLFRR